MSTKDKAIVTEEDLEITIYCDGACSGNPGIGGWGAVLLYGHHAKHISGYDPDTTNNRMEIKAAIEALKSVTKNDIPITIHTDSQYVHNGITSWIHKWRNENWRASNKKKEVKNIDLWMELDAIVNKFSAIKWKWVKGHSNDKYNDLADKLATDAIKEFKVKQNAEL